MQNESIEVQDEIELMDLFKIIWRRKWIIIIIVSVAMLGTVYFLNSQKQFRSELEIFLLWEGVEKGIYPNGSVFTSSDIVTPEILSQLKFGSNLSGHIVVAPIIPRHIQEKISENPEFVFYPDKFKLILIDDNNSFLLSQKEKGEALKNIAYTFIQSITRRISSELLFSVQFPEGFIESSEYEDVVNVLKKYFTSTESVLSKKNELVGQLQIEGIGYNFSDLLSRLFILRSVEFANIVVEIESHHLAKEKERLTTRMLRKVSVLENERAKNQKIIERTLELLSLLKFASPLGISGRSNVQYEINSSVFKELKENDYISYLIKLNLDAEAKVIQKSWEIDNFVKRIEGIKNNGKHFAKGDQEITNRLGAIKKALLNIMKDSNELNYKYIESKFGNGIRINRTATHIVAYQHNPKLILCMALFGSLFFSLVLSFLIDYVSSYQRMKV